jgi:hypothetical protein
MEISNECRNNILKALQKNLDTRDKRFMFLKICFPDLLPNVCIEGSPNTTSWNLYEEFCKQNMVGSLSACLNTYFEEDINLLFK